MTERIVYVLGAGFSADLGIPVMSNFLERAKDQFSEAPEKYSHFEKVFETVNHLSVTKNYYSADLFNIEEILSILEMQDSLEGNSRREEFVRFIRAVVEYHTPPCKPTDKANCLVQLCGQTPWMPYGAFIAAILNCAFEVRATGKEGEYKWIGDETADRRSTYSIVTLNYDLIPEIAVAQMKRLTSLDIGFVTDPADVRKPGLHAVLCKLHGSLEGGPLIPPTWSKHLTDPIITAHWKAAHNVLQDATKIRIVGYSLPVADAYVKYLLKSAVMGSKNLKEIDVICRDNGSVESRFREFITFPKLRFKSGDIRHYLNTHCGKYEQGNLRPIYSALESAHEEFFR